MPEYQFVGDTPQSPLGEALWQPGETRAVDAAQAAELRKNANWKEVVPVAPAAPTPPRPEPAPAPLDPAPSPAPDDAASPEPPAGG